jgi:nucleoside 2-deoxyribosyltransferase
MVIEDNSAEAIIANLTPFRGIAADPGTCFELGYMCAQGKAAFAYTNVSADNGECTRSFYAMGFADNLMLHGGVLNRGGIVVVGDAAEERLYTDREAFKSVLALAASQLRANRAPA